MSVGKTVDDLGTELGERIAETDEYEAFDCRLDESGGRNRAVCRVDDPDRLHVVLVQIDVSLSD